MEPRNRRKPNLFVDRIRGLLPRIGAPADTPYTVLNMIRRLDGESKPIVYLPKITVSAAADQTMNKRDTNIYCALLDDVSIEHVLGSENDSEVWRVSTINLREII